MKAHQRWLVIAGLLVCVGSAATGQAPARRPDQATSFVGTWVFEMTNPAESQETVKISEQNGVITASVQIGKFPATPVTGIVKDGDMLVLTISHEARPGIRENGAPIWAVISLTLNGDTIEMAQMLERSQTIKRGSGKRQSA
jgi:hypothetical protein